MLRRDDGGRRGLPVDQGYLTKEVVGPVESEDDLFPVFRHLGYLHPSGKDDVHERVRILFPKDHLVSHELFNRDPLSVLEELAVGKGRKEREVPQEFEVNVLHGTSDDFLAHEFHVTPLLPGYTPNSNNWFRTSLIPGSATYRLAAYGPGRAARERRGLRRSPAKLGSPPESPLHRPTYRGPHWLCQFPAPSNSL